MKTSNKILISFALIVFSLPAISALLIRGKIARNEYTTVYNNTAMPPDQAVTKPLPGGHYSVIKLNGINGQISCTLYGSNKEGYFNTGKNNLGDSLLLYCANDTLYVNVILKPREGPQRYYQALYLQLYTNSAKSIIINSAHLTLENTGSIADDLEIKLDAGSSVVFNRHTSSGKRAQRLRIDADGGQVRFFTNDAADSTELNLSGTANLQLDDNIFPVKGHIGDSVIVAGSWRALKHFSK